VHHKISTTRLSIALAVTLLLLGGIGFRIFRISWTQHALYTQKAQAQVDGVSNILLRGNIYLSDQGGQEYLVATNKKFPFLAVFPKKFIPAERSASLQNLAAASGVSTDAITKVVDSGTTGSRVLLKKLSDVQVTAIQDLHLPGVIIGYEADRSYPAGTLAADVLGFLGYSDAGRVGQYGVESSYGGALMGFTQSRSAKRWDVWSQLKKLVGGAPDDQAVDEGPNDIILTIDKNIQEYAQTVLDSVLKKYSAASGTLIVQDPLTGRILAMADSPTYNPNSYGSASPTSFLNGALLPFEPGSSFKPFTMAMGLESGVITPSSTFNDSEDVIIDGYTIKNFNEGRFGIVTMSQILEKSINTGAMWVAERVGKEKFLDFVVNLGFGQQTSIDLPGESSGNISNLYTGRRINFMTASFGQGITTTPLQLISGYGAIANGGQLMQPYIVDATRDSHGAVTKRQPKIMGTPFSIKTAALLRTMLTSVVDNGFDKARIPRYDVAGKTGTAQIASPDGGYLEKEYNHNFIGFAPASNPKFVILIRMEKPQGITFAADSLSPSFRQMTLFLLNYMNIPPTR